MFLKQSRTRDGRVYLSIMEGYRENNKVRQRTVEKCGYLDELARDHDDPVAHFKARARELAEARAGENARATIEFDPRERIDARSGDGRIGLGSIPLSYCYHALQLDRFWANRKNRAGLPFDPNAVFRMLCYQRVLRPGASKKGAWERRAELPDRCDFALDHVYRALDFFAAHEEAFKAHVDAALASLAPRPGGLAYYDVTNYYFEVENEDAEGLRARGVSKEHHPGPIVQMGLMMDSRGMPYDYELWRGSTVDCQTMLPALRRVRERHPGQRLVVVADKGLNTSANIVEAVANGDGFIFSQSVRKASKALREWVVDERDYDANAEGTFKVKSRQSWRRVQVKAADGTRRTERVEVQEVAFWSRDFAERSRHEREKVVEKSLAALERGGISSAKAKTGVRYVKDLTYDGRTGEAVRHAYEIDRAKIEADAELDGYYCIVTSETMMGEGEVIDAYRQLWRIEDAFRVTKSTLEARPVFVWTEPRIRAHFMTCFASLVTVRLLQDMTGWRHSADKIQEGLASLVGHREDANWYLFASRSEATDDIGRALGVELNRRRYTRGQIRQMLADSRKPGYGIWLKS